MAWLAQKRRLGELLMRKIICPKEIFDMFKTSDEAELGLARVAAVEWLTANIANLRIGGEAIIPDPATGDPMSFTKTRAGGLRQ